MPRRIISRPIIAFAGLVGLSVVGWVLYAGWPPSVDSLRAQCVTAMENKEWDTAEVLARRWLKAVPGQAEPSRQLAEALRRQRRYEDALQVLGQVSASSPDSEAVMVSCSELLFGPLNRPLDGAEVCRAILRHNSRATVAQQRLIFFLTMSLQRVRMVNQIREAIDLQTEPLESYIYLFFADSLAFSNGIEMNRRWLEGNPGIELFEVSEVIFTAENLDLSTSMDDFTEAQEIRRATAKKAAVLDRLLSQYPHNPELLAYGIRQRIQAGDLNGVVELLAQSTVECESDHRFWRFKGWVHAQRHQVTEAEQSYGHALKLHPLDSTTRHLLAELLQQEQRYEEVKELRDLVSRGSELQRVLRRSPNARAIEPATLSQLEAYASDCGDNQFATGLRKRFRPDN